MINEELFDEALTRTRKNYGYVFDQAARQVISDLQGALERNKQRRDKQSILLVRGGVLNANKGISPNRYAGYNELMITYMTLLKESVV